MRVYYNNNTTSLCSNEHEVEPVGTKCKQTTLICCIILNRHNALHLRVVHSPSITQYTYDATLYTHTQVRHIALRSSLLAPSIPHSHTLACASSLVMPQGTQRQMSCSAQERHKRMSFTQLDRSHYVTTSQHHTSQQIPFYPRSIASQHHTAQQH